MEKYIANLERQDVVYNGTTGLWSCCWNSGAVNCGIRNNQTFQAPSPQQLFSWSTSTTSGTSDTGSAPPVASQTISNTPNQASSSLELSTGVQVGLGVGASIAGVMLVVGLISFFLARRQARKLELEDTARHELEAEDTLWW